MDTAARVIRVGVIGTGRMAATMVAAMRTLPAVRVAAVASGTAGRAPGFAAALDIPLACSDIGDLLGRADIDLVYIANATALHADTSIRALQAHKAVVCEKPCAVSAADGRRIAEAAQKSGAFFMEAMWTPFLPVYQRFSALAAGGTVGKAVQLTASFGYPVTARAHPALFQPQGGGVLLDRGVYPVALALKSMGPIANVQAHLLTAANGVDVHATLQLQHTFGAQSQIAASLIGLMDNTATLAATRGSLMLGAPLVGAEQLRIRVTAPADQPSPAMPQPSLRATIIGHARANPVVRRLRQRLPDGTSEHHAYGASRYGPMLAHVVACLQSGRRESDVIPLAFSLDVLAVLDQARAHGTRTAWEEAAP